ncbi:MAG: hypothetical protein LBU68_02360 [Rickettsiales bacterium]|jgi:hypothetical protein|nr:hypothetical protein [Rickettsiales bacterium]
MHITEKTLEKLLIIEEGIIDLLQSHTKLLSKKEIDPEMESAIFYNLTKDNKLSTAQAYDLMKSLQSNTYNEYEFLTVKNSRTELDALMMDKTKRNFGTNVRIGSTETIKTAIKKLLKNDKIILCEHIQENYPSNGWWIYLLDLDKEIFEKINPDFESTKPTSNKENFYAVGKINSAQDYDRSFIVMETSAPVGTNWIKTVLIKLKIPVYKLVESIATYKSNTVHLIEITGNIDANDSRFGKVAKVGDINFQLLKKIGGYFQKIENISDDKLLFLK